MPLESATYIHQLVVTNPDGGDPKYNGDDHIRMLKAALKNTWANVAGAVSASHTELNYVAGVTSPIQTQLDSKVGLSGDQTVNGIKTFGSLPVLPGNATTNLQAVPKQQLDSGIATCVGLTGDQSIAGNKTFSGVATFSAGAKVIQSGTAQDTASGTSTDFTIPAWAKRITVMFNGVSTNGTSPVIVQLGTGGAPTTSGYSSYAAIVQGPNSCAFSSATSGFTTYYNTAADTRIGTLTLHNVSGNVWVASGVMITGAFGSPVYASGVVTLAGAIDTLRLTTIVGTDSFDAGSVNLLYEG